MAPIKTLKIPPPYEGLNLAEAPQNLSKYQTPYIQNFLVHEDNRLVARPLNGYTALDDATAGYAQSPIAAQGENSVRFDDNGPGETLPPQFDYDDWTDGGGYLDTAIAEGLVIAPAGSQVAGSIATIGRAVSISEYRYAFAMDYSTADDSGATAVTDPMTDEVGCSSDPQAVRPLIQIASDDTAVTYDIDDYPHTGVDVEVHLNRLWTLGGMSHESFSTSVHDEAWSSSHLFYMNGDILADGDLPALDSDVGDGSGPYNIWTDSGAVNRIDIPGSDHGMAIRKLDQNLVIFKQESIWVLYGTGPENFQLRRITDEVGCRHVMSVVTADDGIYFLSKRGLEFFDGYEVRTVSDPVRPAMPAEESVTVYSEEYLLIGNYLYHRPTGRWTMASGDDIDPPRDGIAATGPDWGWRVGGPVLLWLAHAHGYHTLYGYVTSRSSAYGSVLSSDRGSLFELPNGESDGSIAAVCEYYTRVLNLEGLGHRALLSRLAFNGHAISDEGASEDATEEVWTVTVDDVGHNAAPTSLLSAAMKANYGQTLAEHTTLEGTLNKDLGGRTEVWDCHAEAESVVITVKLENGATNQIQEGSANDMELEYQTTHKRRSPRHLSAS